MCNRYRIRIDEIELRRALGLPPGEHDTLIEKELFPKSAGLVVRQGADGRELAELRWGFPPPVQASGPVTNVRNLASPFWRGALANPARRCLVPVTTFCEWEGEKGRKVARWFQVPSLPVFAFAGLWRPTEDGGAYAFLTCDPNPLVGAVHPKAMPVILYPDDHATWLEGSLADATALAVPFPSQLMTMA